MYGPFKRGGCFTGPDNGESNKEFNDYLLSLNNEFGIRDLEWVDALAKEAGLESTEIKEMPAENFCVCYSKII